LILKENKLKITIDTEEKRCRIRALLNDKPIAPLSRSLKPLEIIRVGACESVKNIDHKWLQSIEIYAVDKLVIELRFFVLS